VWLHDPIGTDKEGNEITMIDILGTEADDVVDKVQFKIEKSKIYKNLDILDDGEKEAVMGRFGLEYGGEDKVGELNLIEAHIALMAICAFLVCPGWASHKGIHGKASYREVHYLLNQSKLRLRGSLADYPHGPYPGRVFLLVVYFQFKFFHLIIQSSSRYP
jgi:hypothetical protein